MYNLNTSTLILKYESDYAKYINFFISYINNYDYNEITDNDNKYIFTINIEKKFWLIEKTNKVIIDLIRADKIKLLL